MRLCRNISTRRLSPRRRLCHSALLPLVAVVVPCRHLSPACRHAVVVVVPSLDALRHKRKSAANVGILLAALVAVLDVVLYWPCFRVQYLPNNAGQYSALNRRRFAVYRA